MTEVIDLERGIELLKLAVQERGADYVDPNAAPESANFGGRCRYWNGTPNGEGRPGCIIGTALHLHGHPAETLYGLDYGHNGAGTPAGSLPSTLADDNACALFEQAQDRQDNGMPWGDAVAEAIAEVTEAALDIS